MTVLNSINKETNELSIESTYLGTTDYRRSVNLQQDLMSLALKTKNNFVIGLEHPAVITLGYRAEIEDEINSTDDLLPVERISRGGLATIHSEGQLVIYPVLNLRELGLGVREYVLLLLETTRELLSEMGVDSYVDDKCIGLHTKKGKIAFCGIQVKNGISQHGISLNVRNDLSLFSSIRACGVLNARFDSLQQYGISYTLSEIYSRWVLIFRRKIKSH